MLFENSISWVQLLDCVQLFVTPWTVACQASLSITNFWSWLKFMSIELVMTSNYLILYHPLLLLPSIFPIIRVFSNELLLPIRWPKYWSFSFNISPSNDHPGLISFRMDWLDLLAVQRTLKSLLQHHSSKHQFFGVQLSLWSTSYIYTSLLEKPYLWLDRPFLAMSLLFNMLSRFVIAFLPRNKCLLISWLHLQSALILEPKKIKSAIVSPSIRHEVMGLDAM